MSANSNYPDSSPIVPLIAFPQLDRAPSRARRMDARSGKIVISSGRVHHPRAGKAASTARPQTTVNYESSTHHFGSLEPLWTLGNFESDLLTLIK